MMKFMLFLLTCAFLILHGTAGPCSSFDERLWEKYAEINCSSIKDQSGMASLYLEPRQLGEVAAKPPFADLRIMTDLKEEVPWQVIAKKPEKRREELPSRMHNLSRTGKGETWLELAVEKQKTSVNAVEVITSDKNFSRQVKVLGSADGKTWNILREDGVIFDVDRGERIHHTRITFPPTRFRTLALKIANGNAQPLQITGVKVLQEIVSPGQTYRIDGTTEKPETRPDRKETSIVVRMAAVFPLDRLVVNTAEQNFQRSVEVQIKGSTGNWEHWAHGTIFNYNTAAMRESQTAIDIQEVAAKEFRLIFKNLDSPPLSGVSVSGEGFRRLLVFKQQPGRRLYLFWGNPLARQPQYDLAGLVAGQRTDQLPRAHLGQIRPNTKFAGDKARLPFTDRYKYPLYAVVILAIAGLVFLQYRVFKRIEPKA